MINIFPGSFPKLKIILSEVIWCSSRVTINRISVVHFSIGRVIGLIILIHLFIPHPFCSSNPWSNTSSTPIIPSWPIFWNDCFITSNPYSVTFSYFPYSEPDLIGNSDNPIFANPLSTPNHILPESYYLTFHSCPRSLPDKALGVMVVFMFIVLLMVNRILILIFLSIILYH